MEQPSSHTSYNIKTFIKIENNPSFKTFNILDLMGPNDVCIYIVLLICIGVSSFPHPLFVQIFQ